jgi:hypothetical protein
MKPRHAAALALVGWYLMLPPTSRDYPTGKRGSTTHPMAKAADDVSQQG